MPQLYNRQTALAVIIGFAIGIQSISARSQSPVVVRVGLLEMPGRYVTDVWGYVDETSNKEYAVVGFENAASQPEGIAIVDVTDPTAPFKAAEVLGIPGFDVKVWQHYVYTVNGGSGGSGSVVDISDPTNPSVVGSFPSSHNIFIDDLGYMYAEISGLKIYDLNPDPTTPTLVWQDSTSGGHDASVIGDRLYDFHGSSGTFIYDVTDRTSPLLLGSITDPSIGLHHSGWTTENGRYLLLCDEGSRGANADVSIWDVLDPSNPTRVGNIYLNGTIVHNVHVVGHFALFSYYTAGFRVYDISTPSAPTFVGGADSYPSNAETFDGAFGVYGFSPSGNIFVSGANGFADGLLEIFTVAGIVSNEATEERAPSVRLDVYPTPSQHDATVEIELATTTALRIEVYDLLGRRIEILHDGVTPVGVSEFVWRPSGLAAGVYLVRVDAGATIRTTKVVYAGP